MTTTANRSPLPLVSVIIPARNEGRLIAACLNGIRRLDYPAELVEVIVVDNGSTDETLEVAKRCGVRVLHAEGTIGAVRNHGAAHASGSVLALLDADCVPTPQWLRVCVETLRGRRCVTGATVGIAEDAGWMERAWFPPLPMGEREVRYINSGNLVLPAELFRCLGGFDERLVTGEDTELCARASEQVPIVENGRAVVIHLGNPTTLRQFIRREIWYGLGALGTPGASQLDLPLLGTLAFAALTGAQLAGIAVALASHSLLVLAVSTAVLGGLLSATVLYRARMIRSAVHGVQLAILYYCFYLGRSIALILLVTGKTYYHGIKADKPQTTADTDALSAWVIRKS